MFLPMTRRGKIIFSLLLVGLAIATATASAQSKKNPEPPNARISDGVVKIGLLVDMSSLYADLTGEGSVTAARMASEDFGGSVLGAPIQIVYADHQNKPDVASAIARNWFDNQKVDMIADVAGSATALAVLEIAKQRSKIVAFSGPGATNLTNQNCSPISLHWAYDSYALSVGTAKGVLSTGGDTWFFIAVDNAFGRTMQKDATEILAANGGKVVGSVYPPLNTSDFSSFTLQAQASGAKVIGLANAGGDTVNAVKSAYEFGVMKNQKVTAMLMFINDIHALGLQLAQGMLLTESFYWDANNETRSWSKRYFERMKKMPNMVQAGEYSSIMHYLKAVRATGTDDTATVIEKMKATPVDDFFARGARIRADGRLINDVYLFEVKKPEESKGPWDYYKLRATIPGKEAYMPVDKSTCTLLRKP